MKLILIAIVSVFSISLHAANLPDFPFVLSVGVAERDVTPNEAKISIHLLAFEIESNKALKKVSEASKKIFSALRKYNIDLKKLEAHDIKKRTERDRDRNYNRLDILGYEVSRYMKLNLDNLAQYAELMDDLVAIDNVSDLQTSFDITNRDELEAQLIAEASEDARNKADIMASSLSAKVQSVYAISQATDFADFFATFGAISRDTHGFARDGVQTTTKMFVPESIKVTEAINVVFRIK